MIRSILLITAILASVEAFTTSFMGQYRIVKKSLSRPTPRMQMIVLDIESEVSFDKTIEKNKGTLVVVDYSTTWCGPCKVIAPKFDEFSEKYPQAIFLKVRSKYSQTNPLSYQHFFNQNE
jgi:thiol-disulfide isomerase/thioredoxin